ncbi:class I poly(R)-hydroxyalkanoic acid synthase [Paracoccus aminophilus]|uniref:Polyhydroxyalkanoate synthase n=1 Tax=Paracoccus aminophilus JCM 7686 TaxID=1367847 RepID=S5YDE9_PARAH|nr:class I poly(R)-hydroxyalkanoic acid synthase [Paracoccus aminophilus]AGT09478.1 polyhydroxyalkanoate synthase [Paracoccus aminophilus JCM 7686]
MTSREGKPDIATDGQKGGENSSDRVESATVSPQSRGSQNKSAAPAAAVTEAVAAEPVTRDSVPAAASDATPKPARSRNRAAAKPVEAAKKPAAAAAKPASDAQPARRTAAKKAAPAKASTPTSARASAAASDEPRDEARADKRASPRAAPEEAKAKPRPSTSRARTASRADTRTTTRKKAAPRKVSADAESAALKEPVAPLVEPALPRSPAVQARSEAPNTAKSAPHRADQPADTEPTPRGTAAFMEAAFGPNSHLPEQLMQNIERIEGLNQRLLAALSQRRAPNPGVEAPGPDFFASTAAAWLKQLAEQPSRIIGQQVSYWGETLRHFAETQAALSKGLMAAPEPEDGAKDRRFANPLWDNHPFFSFVKRQYQINAKAMQKAASDLDIEDHIERRRIDWFTRQIIDMMAPTNFLATNPDALEKAVATEGESLVQGLENLVRDVEMNGGEMIVSLADRDAFRVGENIGTSEGSVVARTHLYELIQYKPSTAQVHAIPLVIFPPWINKFYILDLKPQNSLVKWIVDQGYTLFVVAWKNPDVSYAETGLDDYVSAYLEVMDRIQDLTGEEKVNAIGYCIAGTTLSLTLALLKQQGKDRVNSATLFTTLTDFEEQGEFTTYLQNDFVDGIEAEVQRHGVLSSQLMTRTFSFLRANDLVWAPAIRSYMLGEAPPAFDLLYWNGDGTNLPGKMAIEYLRGLCQANTFVKEGYTVLGQNVQISDVTVPICAIACETDHIAPWRDSWRGVAQMGSTDRTFIMSESGHIAGIVNPPSKKKYGHYTSEAGFEGDSQSWLDAASFHPGSWWGRWDQWLAPRSGGWVEARDPGEGFGPAPGQFVHERP